MRPATSLSARFDSAKPVRSTASWRTTIHSMARSPPPFTNATTWRVRERSVQHRPIHQPVARLIKRSFGWFTPLVHRVPSGTAVIDPVLMDNTTAQGGVTAGTTPNVIDFVGYGIEYEVPGGLVPLEDVEPINLPESVVIDLGQINTGSYTGSPPDLTLFSTTNRLSQINPQNNNPLNRWVVMMSTSDKWWQWCRAIRRHLVDANRRRTSTRQCCQCGQRRVPRKEVVVGNSGGHIILAIMSQNGIGGGGRAQLCRDQCRRLL